MSSAWDASYCNFLVVSPTLVVTHGKAQYFVNILLAKSIFDLSLQFLTKISVLNFFFKNSVLVC